MLGANVPFVIDDRDVNLGGVLADGTPFDFELNSESVSDNFDRDATLTITRSVFRGDFNNDGVLDELDIDQLLTEASSIDGTSTDLTGDGIVDNSDRDEWLAAIHAKQPKLDAVRCCRRVVDGLLTYVATQ